MKRITTSVPVCQLTYTLASAFTVVCERVTLERSVWRSHSTATTAHQARQRQRHSQTANRNKAHDINRRDETAHPPAVTTNNTHEHTRPPYPSYPTPSPPIDSCSLPSTVIQQPCRPSTCAWPPPPPPIVLPHSHLPTYSYRPNYPTPHMPPSSTTAA